MELLRFEGASGMRREGTNAAHLVPVPFHGSSLQVCLGYRVDSVQGGLRNHPSSDDSG